MTNQEFIEIIALEGEEWRIIDGTLGYFAVSNQGRVASLSHRVCGGNNNSWMTKPRILTAHPNWGGYLRVRLTSLHGVDMTKLVHRLVAEAFIPNPNKYAYIDHIDGNRMNNVVSNLRWCTRSMNMLNSVTRERAAKARRMPNKRNRKPIAQLKDGILVAKYESASEAHQLHGFHIGGIYECIRKPTRTLKGFHWRWLSDWEASHQ
ncbi:NUMOD4 motif-containing HNH endonuclease [Alistipes putredinis]|uniref:NUMOD4 motif-containing HNH endonuclease n=1 Tax=Alistipes putredinis TaxID=28117 RepID=UPI0040252EFB